MSEVLYLDTAGAAKYLRDRGVILSAGTLNKLRCRGGGPEFRKCFRRVYYEPGALDRWVRERMEADRAA